MKKYLIAYTIFALFVPRYIGATSIVYNLKIGETTKRQTAQKLYIHPSVGAVVFFDRYNVLRGGVYQNVGGMLGTLIYSTQHYYMRMDFAAGHVRSRTALTENSRGQSDDILCTAGYSHTVSERTKLTLSAIVGIPTHKDTILQGIELGTGHASLGVQADGSFIYSANEHHSIRAAARYIRFFERTISTRILENCHYFKFNLGNLVDVLIAHHSNWNKNAIEIGYNPTFLFGASINPSIAGIISETDFIRSSFYATYGRFFMIGKNHPSGVGVGFSYGLDHIPRLFGNKYVITGWVTWGINF